MWDLATDKQNGPTFQRVKELFDYDPATGTLTRRVTVSSRAKKGMVVGCLNRSDGYLVVQIDHHIHGRLFQVHRIIWFWMTGKWPECQIDHRNGKRSDNRWDNLREANNSQNTRNQGLRKDNSTGVKGVDIRRGKFRVRIHVNGKEIVVGRFLTLEEAKKARYLAERKYFDDF